MAMPRPPEKPRPDPRMEARAVFLAGLFELCGLGAFIAGYFMDILWLMVAGGCMLVLDDMRLIRRGHSSWMNAWPSLEFFSPAYIIEA